MSAPEPATAAGSPRVAKFVVARSGVMIDTSTDEWRLSADNVVVWSSMPPLPEHIVAAAQEYVRRLIRTGAPDYVASQFLFLQRTLRSVEDSVPPSPDDDLEPTVFTAAGRRLAAKLGLASTRDYLGAYRRWYVWCSDAGFDGFDEDTATDLEERRIGTSAKGVAVLSHDPDRGPLNNVEFSGLASKLRSPAGEALPLTDRVACWLCLCFGLNGKSLRLLHEDDLLKNVLDDGTVVYELRIPRIKKRTAGERDAFKIRPLDVRVGALAENLIAANAAVRAQDPHWDGTLYERHLFARSGRSDSLAWTRFSRDAYRSNKRSIYAALRRVADALDLRAFPSGGRLGLSTRRLRYTYATRLVQAGASPLDVAEALDHSNTRNIMVYFNSRADVVSRLDEKLAVRLAPLAQAFLGTLIRSEAEATRAGDPASRVKRYDRDARELHVLGSCGSFGFCGLFAPVACYTCVLFQPWLDGPHATVLAELVRRRDLNLERGTDPKLTQMHDLTIYAVAEVVRRCRAMDGDPGPGGAP